MRTKLIIASKYTTGCIIMLCAVVLWSCRHRGCDYSEVDSYSFLLTLEKNEIEDYYKHNKDTFFNIHDSSFVIGTSGIGPSVNIWSSTKIFLIVFSGNRETGNVKTYDIKYGDNHVEIPSKYIDKILNNTYSIWTQVDVHGKRHIRKVNLPTKNGRISFSLLTGQTSDTHKSQGIP